MSYGTTFRVELHEPEITLTSDMIRWAIIRAVQEEQPDAFVARQGVDMIKEDQYAVDVHFVARNKRGKS